MKHRALSLLLVLALALSLMPVSAAADGEGDATGYQQIQVNEVDYTLYTTEAYPWTGSGTYTSGNAGEKNTISTLKLVVNTPGLLKFDWTVSYTTRLAYFAYRVGDDYTSASQVTSQTQHKYGGEAEGSESVLLVAEGDEVYFTYYKANGLSADNTVDDIATVSNLRIEEYIQTDVGDFDELIVYDNAMGTVTAQWMEPRTDDKGYDYVHMTDVEMSALTDEGNTYRLKAVAKDGYQFYGWVQTYTYNGQLKQAFKGMKYYKLTEKTWTVEDEGTGEMLNRISNEKATITVPELEAKLDGNSQYTAVFAPEGSYAVRVNTSFYGADDDLADIISTAVSGDMIEILSDVTLTADATVKKGVTLYVPFRPNIGSEDEASGKYRAFNGTAHQVVQNADYVTLTIPSEVELTVKGTLAVGARVGAAGQGMQGHISGAYGEIANNGDIAITEKGTMITYGLVTGTGTVLAQNYGIVKESLIIGDFSGGSNSLALYTDQQIPFKRFTMQNIQCALELERYGTLSGLISLYAIGGFNEVEADVVGVTSMSIFWPNDTGISGSSIILHRTYSPQFLGSGADNSSGMGKTTWNVYGGLVFRSLTLNLGVATVKTDHVDFPIPPHMDFVMNDGLYDIPGKLKIMPGSHMTVGEDATLKINGKLIVLDGLKQKGMSGYAYPTRAQLDMPGYGGSGEFVLNGTLRITEGSTLGGMIQSTSDTGILIIEEGTYLKNSTADLSVLDATKAVDLDISLWRQEVPETDTWVIQTGEGNDLRFYDWVQQDGGKGAYDDNTTWFNLPARVYNGTDVIELTPGTWKSSIGSYEFTDVFQQRWCDNAKTVNGEVGYTGDVRTMPIYNDSFTRTVNGIWAESTSAVEITSSTVAGSSNTGVSVDSVAVRNPDGSTTLTLTAVKNEEPVTEKYVFLVKYVTATGTMTAEGSNGVYTIPAEGQSVTVESALLGDPNGDGRIAATDLLFLKQSMTGKRAFSELQTLTVDINGNNRTDAVDLLRVKQLLTGKIDIF